MRKKGKAEKQAREKLEVTIGSWRKVKGLFCERHEAGWATSRLRVVVGKDLHLDP